MSSIVIEPNGCRRIEVFVRGKRPKLRLGKISKKHAQAIQVRIDHLAAAANRGLPLDDETARWVATRDEATLAQLERAGLAVVNRRAGRTLKTFLADVLKTQTVKASTLTAYGHAERNLLAYFGDDGPLTAIGPEEAEKFQAWLRDHEKLAAATVSRRIRACRQFFKRAVKWKLVAENPFAEVKAGGEANPRRLHFVGEAVAAKVIKACPDAEWRLIFALSRYGGFRCPTEHLALRWADVDWDAGMMQVRSEKKATDKTGGVRDVPIFEQLEPYLREAFELAPEGAVYVINRYRRSNVNLRTQLLKIIDRAGVAPWPRLFQNLRSSRETELAQHFPIHVVCAWIGNSEAVARKHYLHVLDGDVQRARGAAQNAAHSAGIKKDQQVSQKGSNVDNSPENGNSRPEGRESDGPYRARSSPGNEGETPPAASDGALSGAPARRYVRSRGRVVLRKPRPLPSGGRLNLQEQQRARDLAKAGRSRPA